MKFVLTVFLAFITFSQAVSEYDLVDQEWNTFKLMHKKNYQDTVEDRYRKEIFINNKFVIALHNAKYENGERSHKLGINKYADMLHTEIVRKMNGFNKTQNGVRNFAFRGGKFVTPANVELPNKVDWRLNGAVTPVKDQGHCGSCWAFSSTGALEGQHFRSKGYLVSLSEQNLIDCSSKYGNNGCNGGLMDNAFRYIEANRGIDTEKSYPYEAENDKCRYKAQNSGADDVGFIDIPEGDEKKLKAAVATVGPISVAIDASHQSFQLYAGGVYDEPECSSETLDHGVLVVGYGTTENGQDYWIVKNSWGDTWGEKGYIKMSRNKHNQCGIASSASYPIV